MREDSLRLHSPEELPDLSSADAGRYNYEVRTQMLGSYKTDTAESDASPHPHDRAIPSAAPKRVPTPSSLGVPGVPPAVDELTPSPQYSLTEALARVEADRSKQQSSFVWPIALPLPGQYGGRSARPAIPPPEAPTIPMNGASTWLLAIAAVAFLLTAALIFHGTLHPRPAANESAQRAALTRKVQPAAPQPTLATAPAAPIVVPEPSPTEAAEAPASATPETSAAQHATRATPAASAAPRTAAAPRRATNRAERVPWWE